MDEPNVLSVLAYSANELQPINWPACQHYSVRHARRMVKYYKIGIRRVGIVQSILIINH